jgi:MFS family permease
MSDPLDLGWVAPARRSYGWMVAGLLGITAILSYTDRQVLSLIVDPVRADLAIDDTQMSLLLGTAFALVYGVAGVPLGWLADRGSRRNMILGGLVVWSAGTIGCGLAGGFGQLFGARLVVGLGEAVLSPAAISLISDYFPPSQRGRAVGLYFTGICIGVGGSFLIGGEVLKLVRSGLFASGPFAALPAWRVLFLVIGVPSLLWGVVLLAIREPPRGLAGPAAPEQRSAVSSGRGTLLSMAPIFATVALASLVDNAVGGWAPSLLQRRFGVDPAEVGLTLGYLLIFAYGGGMLTGGWCVDFAARKSPRRGKIILCAVSSLSVLPLTLLIDAGTPTLVLTGIGLYFALSAFVTASGLSVILDHAPSHLRGTAMAVSFFLNVAVGAGLGPSAVILSGGLLFGEAAGLGPAIAFTAASAFVLAAAAALFALRATRTK